jgi:hypothetical protein
MRSPLFIRSVSSVKIGHSRSAPFSLKWGWGHSRFSKADEHGWGSAPKHSKACRFHTKPCQADPESYPVLVVREYLPALDSTENNVMQRSRRIESGFAWHEKPTLKKEDAKNL